jgi:hypothetical protein
MGDLINKKIILSGVIKGLIISIILVTVFFVWLNQFEVTDTIVSVIRPNYEFCSTLCVDEFDKDFQRAALTDTLNKSQKKELNNCIRWCENEID